jgi:hypothetical protein
MRYLKRDKVDVRTQRPGNLLRILATLYKLRYTVRIGKRETYLFLEPERGVDRWFMERR